MSEYIEREALISDIVKRYCEPCEAIGKDHNHCACRACWVDDMIGEIEDFPSTDVAPVKYGKWLRTDIDGEAISKCSVCKYPVSTFWNESNFCPNCGAKMNLEVSKEAAD